MMTGIMRGRHSSTAVAGQWSIREFFALNEESQSHHPSEFVSPSSQQQEEEEQKQQARAHSYQALERLANLSLGAQNDTLAPIMRCIELVRQPSTAHVQPLSSPLELYPQSPLDALVEDDSSESLDQDASSRLSLPVSPLQICQMAGSQRTDGLFIVVPKVIE